MINICVILCFYFLVNGSQACKDYQNDPDFCVVARMEAFIAGWGLEETIKRADVALAAGADAILVHSKRSDSEDIEAFMRYWGTKVCTLILFYYYYLIMCLTAKTTV